MAPSRKFARLDQSESKLIKEFEETPPFNTSIPFDLLRLVLLERREISLLFDEIYARMVVAISDDDLKRVVRRIVRDEYPAESMSPGGRSHREDLVVDLINIGISLEEINQFTPSDVTVEIIDRTRSTSRLLAARSSPTLACAAFLRMWGEVLTAVEYKALWRCGLSRYFAVEEESVFYWNHFKHDKKQINFAREFSHEVQVDDSHSDQLTNNLRHIISGAADAKIVEEVNILAADLKRDFYRQFVRS